jgi:recombinational DNA repair protein RecT
MTKPEAIAHAKKYAKSRFDPAVFEQYEKYMQTGEGMTQQEAEGLGVYYQHFDTMAQKNVMLRLLKRWAPLSVTEQRMLAEDENPGEAFDMPGFESKPEQPGSVAEPVTTGASANRGRRPKDVTPDGDDARGDFFS